MNNMLIWCYTEFKITFLFEHVRESKLFLHHVFMPIKKHIEITESKLKFLLGAWKIMIFNSYWVYR